MVSLTRDSRTCPVKLLSLALPSSCTGKDILYLSPDPPLFGKEEPPKGLLSDMASFVSSLRKLLIC